MSGTARRWSSASVAAIVAWAVVAAGCGAPGTHLTPGAAPRPSEGAASSPDGSTTVPIGETSGVNGDERATATTTTIPPADSGFDTPGHGPGTTAARGPAPTAGRVVGRRVPGPIVRSFELTPSDKRAGTPGLGIRATVQPLTAGAGFFAKVSFETDDETLHDLVVRVRADEVVAVTPTRGTCSQKDGEILCIVGTVEKGEVVFLDFIPANAEKGDVVIVMEGTAEDGTAYEGSFDAPLVLE